MSQPLYFLPRVTWTREQSIAATRAIIRAAGLSDLFSDVPESKVGFNTLAGRGPGELSGTIIFYVDDREPPHRMGYYPDEQTWHPVGDGSQLWVGIDTDRKPTPAELKRRLVHSGYQLELADGNQYTIPVIRRPDNSTNLPTDFIFDAAGKLQEPIKDAYRSYWDASAEVCQWFYSESPPDFNKLRAINLAIDVLRVNYRYSVNEQNALRLVDATNWMAILAMSVDLPRVQAEREAQKKT